MPPVRLRYDRLKISAARINNMQRTRESMSFPVLLQSALESYFSFSSKGYSLANIRI